MPKCCTDNCMRLDFSGTAFSVALDEAKLRIKMITDRKVIADRKAIISRKVITNRKVISCILL